MSGRFGWPSQGGEERHSRQRTAGAKARRLEKLPLRVKLLVRCWQAELLRGPRSLYGDRAGRSTAGLGALGPPSLLQAGQDSLPSGGYPEL